MPTRNRIKELRQVPASQLRAHPRNWRTHPIGQRRALEEVLATVGYAGALLARELENGSLELIDGHLRAEVTPDDMVPVLVLDVSADEADLILLTHDPLTGMAEANAEAVANLMQNITLAPGAAVESMLADYFAEAAKFVPPSPPTASPTPPGPECEVRELFQVVVECRDESHQRCVYEQLTAEGFSCRLLML